ncbi:hypothetical protein [Pararhizobium gei]|uniref:hypothetical protein n=1 Tax=Pararhizobium gei TaxID=1395951 RepID=UPI0023DC25BB|nr:hypothetical protein [Rhizobium gei]
MTDDANTTPEQKAPLDVHRPPGKPLPADGQSIAPPTVQPSGKADESDRPVVNPVTGGAF